MTVASENQPDIMRVRSDQGVFTPDADHLTLNFCCNALEFAQAVHSAYTAVDAMHAHSWVVASTCVDSRGVAATATLRRNAAAN